MKIVIDIPKTAYEYFAQGLRFTDEVEMAIIAIVNGTPLPKGHGDLIDRSKIYKAIPAEEDNCAGMGMTLEEMDAYNDGIDAMYLCIKGAPTIIKADNESEE